MRSKVSKLVETCQQAEKWPKGLKRQKSFCGFADTSVTSIFRCTLNFGLNGLPIFGVLMLIKCEATFLVGVAAKIGRWTISVDKQLNSGQNLKFQLTQNICSHLRCPFQFKLSPYL
jgi:hypothetical protein